MPTGILGRAIRSRRSTARGEWRGFKWRMWWIELGCGRRGTSGDRVSRMTELKVENSERHPGIQVQSWDADLADAADSADWSLRHDFSSTGARNSVFFLREESSQRRERSAKSAASAKSASQL